MTAGHKQSKRNATHVSLRVILPKGTCPLGQQAKKRNQQDSVDLLLKKATAKQALAQLQDAGYQVSITNIKRHKQRECACS